MVSIIILSYKSPALIRLCLKSLARALRNTLLDYEVVVVDNATSTETRQVVTEDFANVFKSLRLVPLKENTGYTFGVNEGIRASRGEYILSLNQDIVMIDGCVEKLVQYMQDHPRAGLVGPELLNFNETHQDSYFRFYSPFTILYRRVPYLPFAKRMLDSFLMHDTSPSHLQEVDWISGAAFMTTQTAIKRVGLLDERLFHYLSDVDWARRFWDNGMSVVYYPEAQMYHYLGRASKGRFGIFDPFFNKTTRWHIMDGIKYFLKWGIRRPKRGSLKLALS